MTMVRVTDEMRARLEAAARADHAAAVGKVFLVSDLTGYSDDPAYDRSDGYFDVCLSYPARVRVLETGAGPDHWCDEFLDPYWDVELAEPHPELPADIRTMWTYGPSYHGATGERRDAPTEDYSCCERGYY